MKKYIKYVITFVVVFVILLIIVLSIFNKKNNVINKEGLSLNSTDYKDNLPLESINMNLSQYNGKVDIKNGGVYHLSGKLEGYIYIDTKEDVRLVLDNINISSSGYPCIYIKNSKKVILTVLESTINTLTDSIDYNNSLIESEVDATIFSKDNLIINGSGTLNINSNYKDAIASKDNLIIFDGIFNINSNDDGLRGKELVYIDQGTFNITSNGDCIKSTNTTDDSLGNINIKNGTFNLKCFNDAIQASNSINIDNGEFVLSTNSTNLEDSSKGIKATKNITISSGNFDITTIDDSIHSNLNININGGNYVITTEDDGIHADDTLNITDGNIDIKKSYEGIEATNMCITSGEIYILATDDGINASGGNDSSGIGYRKDNFSMSDNAMLKIDGGYIYVNARGDGVDSNGSISMNGGTLIVDGPTNSGNGSLDFDKEFNINNGILIASGSNGMAQTPSNTSSQNTISINSNFEANELIYITDVEGNEIISYAPSKNYQSFIVSTPDIALNEKYNIYTGVCYEYNNKMCKKHNEGNLLTTLTINNVITSYGSQTQRMNPLNNDRKIPVEDKLRQ